MDNYDYTAPFGVTSLGLSNCISTTLPHRQRKTTDKLAEANEHLGPIIIPWVNSAKLFQRL